MVDDDEQLLDFPSEPRNDADTDVPTAPADPENDDSEKLDLEQPLNPA